MELLNTIGIPDDNQISVLFNEGSLREGKFNFPGNNAFIEQLKVKGIDLQTLVLGGASQSKQVPLRKFDLIFNSICNPDIQQKSLQLLHNFVKASKSRIINAPEAVLNSSRDRSSELLQGIEGVVMPKTVRITPKSRDEVTKAAAALGYPLLFRSASEHGGRTLLRADSEAELLEGLDTFALDGQAYYLTEYVEYGDSEGIYRKCRYIVAGDKVIARHLIPSKSWKIHAGTRAELIETDQRFKDEEIAFVSDKIAPQIKEAALAIKRRIGLDIFGIDAHLKEDGTLLIFEVNACMRYFGSRQNNYIDTVTDTITEAIEALIQNKS